jgi:[amino group carrier protein]-lysine/ornithine hydrolase
MNDVELLEGLVKVYSPTHQEDKAVAYLVEQMKQRGMVTFIDKAGNAVGSRGEGPNQVLLLGHIDTVPGCIEVHRQDDLLFGRGSVDAKGPLACFASAAARVSPPPGWQVTVIGAVGEEGNSRGAMYIRDHYHPMAIIIGEPSKWDRITLGFKGSLWVDYTLRRSEAHTAGKAISACETAVEFWDAIRSWCEMTNHGIEGAFNQITPTLRGMDSSSDGFTQTAHLRINLRLPPTIHSQAVTEQLNIIKGEAQIRIEDGFEAYRADKNTPLVRTFLRAIRASGGQPSFSLKTGTSDMNLVAPLWGCPAVAYGPGDSNLDHTPNEHVSIQEYLKSIEVLALVLKEIMGE